MTQQSDLLHKKSPSKLIEKLFVIIGPISFVLGIFAFFPKEPGCHILLIAMLYIALLAILLYLRIYKFKKNFANEIIIGILILTFPGVITIVDYILDFNLTISTMKSGEATVRTIKIPALAQTFIACILLIGLNIYRIRVIPKLEYALKKSFSAIIPIMVMLILCILFDSLFGFNLIIVGSYTGTISFKYIYLAVISVPIIFYLVYSFFVIKKYNNLLKYISKKIK